MPRILLNGREQRAETACHCWGDLLARLDRRCAANGQVLTAVRFDGVEQPSFRDTLPPGHPLGGIRVIDGDAISPHRLLEASLDEAAAAAGALATSAEKVGAAFRGFDVATAGQDLSQLAKGLSTLVMLAQTAGQAAGVDLQSLTCVCGTGTRMIEELSAHAEAVIRAQRAGDWIAVADVIEYDIAPALRSWPALFDALRQAIAQGDGGPAA
jgi:hypothetical protein